MRHAARWQLPALLGTQIASTVGSQLTGFAWAFWLFAQTGSATWLGVLFLATTLPGILAGPHAGSVVDRFPRRLVMLVADATAGVATLAGVAMFLSSVLSPATMAALAAVISLAGAFQEPAYGAALTSFAPPDRLERVNGVVQMGPALGIVVAAPLAGALLAAGGLGLVMTVDLATFVVAAATLSVLRFDEELEPRIAAAGPRPRVREGWRIIRDDPGLLTLALTATAINLLIGVVNVLLVPLLLGFTGEATAGLVLGAFGLGMLTGSVLIASLGSRGRPVVALGVGIAMVGVGVIVMGLRPSPALAAVGGLVTSLPVPIVSSVARSLTQRSVDGALLGRVLALQRTIATAALPVAYLAAGPLADRIFEPLMSEGGRLAGTLGSVVGVGPGRGVALMFLVAGSGVMLLGAWVLRDRRLLSLAARLEPPASPGARGTIPVRAEAQA